MKQIALLALLVVATSAGCATGGAERSAQRLELIEQNSSAPVPSVRLTQMHSWESLGDEHLLLWSTPRNAYLLTVDGFCTGLSGAFNITLDYMAPTLSARFDHVLVQDPGMAGPLKCQIQEIRTVDVKALKVAEREARAARKAEKSS